MVEGLTPTKNVDQVVFNKLKYDVDKLCNIT